MRVSALLFMFGALVVCCGRAEAQPDAAAETGAGTETGAETETGTGAGAETEAETETEAEAEYPRLRTEARLMGGAELVRTRPTREQRAADSRQPFFLQQARVKLKVDIEKGVRLSFSADLEDEPAIVNAYANVRWHRELQLRLGRFKRPFSRIELESRSDLPFRERGVWNDHLVEDAGWGDRSLGLMLHGKVKRPRLRYYAAVMNSAPSVDVGDLEQLRGVDVLGRFEYAPVKAFELGINGGHKLTEAAIEGANLHLNAVGLDARFRSSGWEAVIEGNAAQNQYPPTPPVGQQRTPWALTVIGYVSYEWELSGELSLQPVVLGEWTDTDADVAEDETARGVFGVNLLWGKWLRLLPQVELVRPLNEVGARSELRVNRYYLLVFVEL